MGAGEPPWEAVEPEATAGLPSRSSAARAAPEVPGSSSASDPSGLLEGAALGMECPLGNCGAGGSYGAALPLLGSTGGW